MSLSVSSIRDVPPADLTACLQWLLQKVTQQRAQWIVAQLTDRVARKRIADIVAVESHFNGAITGAAITILQPPAAATVLAIYDQATGPEGSQRQAPEMESAVMKRLLERLGPSGVRFLQASADSPQDAIALANFGFEEIAELVFLVLEADLLPNALIPAAKTDVRFEVVGQDNERLAIACDIAARSFTGTQDCPRLSQFRSAGEIVDGYKTASTFDPTLWRILICNREPAGCLFLTAHRPSPEAGKAKNCHDTTSGVIELSYMGLVPERRGLGLGDRILDEAYGVARSKRAARMVLAVDRDNSPALALYRRHGWAQAAGESVWGMNIFS